MGYLGPTPVRYNVVMREVKGKTAFITGGASGIGFGMAQAFADAGMNVAVADIEERALADAAEKLASAGANVLTTVLDVTDRDGFARAADAVEARFGNVHVICNNAGVSSRGPIERASYDDWDWVMGVNLDAVFNGIHTFIPRIKAHGEGGHIVNTSSIAGHVIGAGNGIYTTTKFAVVALSETLRLELANDNIGVTVVCPGAVKTRFNDSDRNRQPAYSNIGNSMTAEQKALIVKSFDHGTEPRDLGEMILDAIRQNRLYVLPHAEFKPVVQARYEAIMAAFSHDPPDPERAADNEYRVRGFAKFWE